MSKTLNKEVAEIRDIQPEEIAPIVNLVNDLEEKSGGHESEYGSLGDITWSTRKYSSDEYLTVRIKFDNWTFWNGNQLQALINRVNKFAEKHDNRNSRIYYMKQGSPVSVSLKLPEDNTQKSGDDL